VLIAQAALESGWGVYVKEHAYFGIKAHNTKNSTTSFTTTEFIDGKKIIQKDSFRSYKDFGDAAEDYGLFLNTNNRYLPAFDHTSNPLEFTRQLQKSGYATDPDYSKKLNSIIINYYLDDYDNE
jgi:flagellum-specific peptidoglycan hydrolase FlgJ